MPQLHQAEHGSRDLLLANTPHHCYPYLIIFAKTSHHGTKYIISLGDHFENFVDHRVAEGRFKNANEVIRAGLRLLEEEESKIIALKAAIAEGIESGPAKNFNPQKHLKSLKAAKQRNG